MKLLPATADDIAAIQELAQRIWSTHYPGILSREQIVYMLDLIYSTESLLQQMEGGQQFWLIKENETSPALGFLAVSARPDGGLAPLQPYLTHHAAGTYFLHKFYLDQRDKGAGTAVFHLLLAQYPDLRALRLTVNRQNFKSINFYFKIGFIIEACVDMPIGAGYVMDDFVMLWQQKRAG